MSSSGDVSSLIANALGYFLGFASLMLYTPIAIRVYRQKHANGLTISTWWLKLAGYTCTDIYNFTKRYPISTYIDTLTITFEAAIILILVAFYQKRIENRNFRFFILLYCTWLIYGLTLAPLSLISLGQIGAAALNSLALIPQFYLNYKTRSKGDYSPNTAGLAATGCVIRLYTITQLAESDAILLGSFGLAAILNTSLLLQILYFGTQVEKLSIKAVFAADIGSNQKTKNTTVHNKRDETVKEEDSISEMEALIEEDMKNPEA